MSEEPTIVFLTPRRIPRIKGPRVEFATSRRAIRDLMTHGATPTLWVEHESKELLQFLIQQLVNGDPVPHGRDMLLTLSQWSAAHCMVFEHLFARSISSPGGVLSPEELAEVLQAPDRRDLCVAGFVDHGAGVMTLVRGDLTTLLVPLTSFDAAPRGPRPDFTRLAVIDHGQTVRFGEYEAAVEAVLYENDPDHRRRKRKEEQATEDSLGASIRRLRKQRKLPRSAFKGIPARSLARIERGEVERPHARTLERIAGVLQVSVDQLGTF